MNKVQIPTSSVFATAAHSTEEVAEIIRVGLETANPSGRISRPKVEQVMGDRLTINYNRWWLFVRRAWFQVNTPTALVDIDPILAAHKAKIAELQLSDPSLVYDELQVLGPIAADLRFEKGYSWGDIMCLMGITEGRARKAFERAAHLKARGLRNGRGGRFAYGDPTLYLENMKSEGAQLPEDLRGRPSREQALNYKPVEAEAAPKPVRKPAKKAG
jgi:hypothetical protein